MKKIVVSDVTLRAYAEQKNTLSFREKLNTAQLLDQAGVSAVELPAMVNDKEDAVVCRTIAGALKNAAVAIPADSAEGLEAAWACVKDAAKPCLQILLPTSTVQMEYTYHLKAPKMLEKIAALCKAASALCHDVELVARDASRAEEGFIAACCKTAEENGATAVTVCDDSGIYFPEDYAALIAEIKAACNLKLYIQPSNALSMAAACAIEAIKAGADGIKTAVCGDYLAADTLADIFRAKADTLAAESALDSTAIHNITAKITWGCAPDPAAETEAEAVAMLDESASLAEVAAAVSELGYDLSEEDNGKVYEEFKRVIAKKETIGARELEAIVASAAMQVPSTFHVINYVVNSGNIITATAHVTLEKNGEQFSGVSTGDGPIDAAFHAIEQIVGHHYELDDFQVQAVTKGREAVGSSLIRLRAEGKLYSGNGVSTDIVGACIRAYVNALNKIVYEVE